MAFRFGILDFWNCSILACKSAGRHAAPPNGELVDREAGLITGVFEPVRSVGGCLASFDALLNERCLGGFCISAALEPEPLTWTFSGSRGCKREPEALADDSIDWFTTFPSAMGLTSSVHASISVPPCPPPDALRLRLSLPAIQASRYLIPLSEFVSFFDGKRYSRKRTWDICIPYPRDDGPKM